MKRTILFFALVCCTIVSVHAQVAINTTGNAPHASAMLDIVSTTSGFLPPRMTTTERNAVSAPAAGLMVYDTDEAAFWYYDGAQWAAVGGAGGGTPAGVVVATAASVAPADWLLCDGSAVSRTTYADLFAAIGTTYGAGDGSTTFNLPDLRGRVVAGKDNMGGSAANRMTSGVSGVTGTTLGANGGSQSHTLTASQMPSHNHSTTINRINGSISGSSWQVLVGTSGTGSVSHTSSTEGGNQAHPIVQPTLILNYIIKI